VAAALATVAGAVAKVAGDVVLLAQSEVGEVRDRAEGRGGSSAMPNKRNPVAAIAARAAAQTVPGPVATLFAAMAHEHERAAGAWHAEWLPLRAALRATGSAVAWTVDMLEHLEPVPAAMAANLARAGGLLHAETVAAALAHALGRPAAQQLVEQAAAEASARGIPLRLVLSNRDIVRAVLDTDALDALFRSDAARGATEVFIDRAVTDARAWAGPDAGDAQSSM